jgi:hypothetical protein
MRRNTATSVFARAGAALLIVALAAALLGTAGCQVIRMRRARSSVTVPTIPVGIIGEIKSIDQPKQEGGVGSMRVEGGRQPEGAASDKAMVTFTDETVVARGDRRIPARDLAVGMTVRVWFEGAVAESYPVQGSAGFIEVR